jgi:hypothetical protein
VHGADAISHIRQKRLSAHIIEQIRTGGSLLNVRHWLRAIGSIGFIAYAGKSGVLRSLATSTYAQRDN